MDSERVPAVLTIGTDLSGQPDGTIAVPDTRDVAGDVCWDWRSSENMHAKATTSASDATTSFLILFADWAGWHRLAVQPPGLDC